MSESTRIFASPRRIIEPSILYVNVGMNGLESSNESIPNLYIHLTKWGTLRIRRFEGRFIYEKKATDLRIIRIRTQADYLIWISRKVGLKLGRKTTKRNRTKRNETSSTFALLQRCLIPFGSERRRGKQNKGAPKILLDFCSTLWFFIRITL